MDEKISNKPLNSEAAMYNAQLGLAYLEQGNRPQAKHKLLSALAQDPNSVTVNTALAYYMEQTGEMHKAKLYYQKAIRVAPHSGAQLNNYGVFLCRQGSYNQAEDYFLRAAKDLHYEHTAAVYENAGLCAMAKSNDTKAILYFSKALEHDPSRQRSLYEMVKIDMKLGRFHSAQHYLNRYHADTLHEPKFLRLVAAVKRKIGNNANSDKPGVPK